MRVAPLRVSDIRGRLSEAAANSGFCASFELACAVHWVAAMDIQIFPTHELIIVLRALRNVAAANDRFTDAERALLEGVARIHAMDVDADELDPISADEVARVIVDPHRRKRVVQLAIVMALVEGTPAAVTENAVRELAAALGLDEEGLEVLYEVAHGRAFLARVDMFRRVRRFLGKTRNFPGFVRIALPFLGVGDEETAAAYRALGQCAPGTFGRALHGHFVDNGFKFPGEPAGIPLIFHDAGHVLSGYSTDPQGEIQQAAFQAGFARRDGFLFLLFGILQFHIGMRITPIAKGYKGLFDVSLVLDALRRGAACRIDLSEAFDVFALKDRPVDELRSELGIPPPACP